MNNPVLLIAFPLLFSFLPTLFKKWEKASLVSVILFNIIALFFIEKGVYNIGGWEAPFGINLVLDNYSFIGVLIVNLVFALSVLISFESIGKYSIVLLISLASLNGMILTGDLFNLFVFMEIGAISAYILSSITKKYKFTFNYLVIGTLGSGLYLLGTIILYGIFGSLNMTDISEKIIAHNVNPAVLMLPAVLIFIGLAVEAKLLPFNGWVKGVFGNANSLVGSIFASAYAATTVIVFGRLFVNLFLISEELKIAFTVIAVATFVLAEFAAFSRKSLRDILLFSSIAQSGLVIALMLSGLVYPALLQLLNNVVAKLVLFTVAGLLAYEAGSDNVDELSGIFKKHKLVGFGFTVVTLSMVGLPLFFGFYAKINILLNLFNLNNLWLPVVILLASIIEGGYFIRLLAKLWNPGEEGFEASNDYVTERSLKATTKVGIVAALIAVLFIITGIFPNLISNRIEAAASSLNSDVPAYSWDWSGGMKQ